MGIVLDHGERSLSLRVEGGEAMIRSLKIHHLLSAWKRKPISYEESEF